MNIWQFNEQVTRRLMTWNAVNLVCGLALANSRDAERRGIGTQAAGWAVINVAIAIIGGRATRQRAQKADALKPETLTREARNLRRLLWLNAGLDVGYMLGGWWYARREGKRPFRRGMGTGIIIQGLLLFIFDVTQAWDVPE